MKKKKNSIAFELFLCILGIALGVILLTAHAVNPFLNQYLFIGIIILCALCAAAIIAAISIKRKIDKGDD